VRNYKVRSHTDPEPQPGDIVYWERQTRKGLNWFLGVLEAEHDHVSHPFPNAPTVSVVSFAARVRMYIKCPSGPNEPGGFSFFKTPKIRTPTTWRLFKVTKETHPRFYVYSSSAVEWIEEEEAGRKKA
jgi:hypothetical protein